MRGVLFFFPILLVILVRCQRAKDHVVTLADGTQYEGSENIDLGVEFFKGVRYAEPPTGELRFVSPSPFKNKDTSMVLDATKYGAHCVQTLWPNGSEDCLYLNIFTGSRKVDGMGEEERGGDSSLKPVLVFIHGGSYTTGSSKFYPGEDLVAFLGAGVVVVTIEYRLNIFGFLGFEELRDGGNGSTGNYGLQDQRMALKWVNENIDKFGGDSREVTIMGESAGGGSVSNHLTAKESWPFFSAAIIESGSFAPWCTQNMERAQSSYEEMLRNVGCADVACLRLLSAEQLLEAQSHVATTESDVYLSPWVPTADGIEMTTHPWIALETAGGVYDVPLLHGTNSDEGILFTALDGRRRVNMSELVDYWSHEKNYTPQEIAELTRIYVVDNSDKYPVTTHSGVTTTEWWALQRSTGDSMFSCAAQHTSEALAKLLTTKQRRSHIFFYHFKFHSWHSAYSVHGSELPFAFHWPLGQASSLDVADTLSTYWGNFAVDIDHNPNPNNKSVQSDDTLGLPTWPTYTSEGGEILLLDVRENISGITNLKSAECAFHIPRMAAAIDIDFPHK